MNSAPTYINRVHLASPMLQYSWDEWNLEQSIGLFDQETHTKLKSMSLRAAFAMLVGSAEWIVYRFEDLMSDEQSLLPFHAVDTGWAQVVDPKYGIPWNPFDEWTGPVLGPIRQAMMLMQDGADYLGKRVEVARPAAKVIKLAEHVMPDKSMFKTWENQVLERLMNLFPWSETDPLGDPVPREALDPTFAFHLSQTELLISQYLRQLIPEENAFLSSPEQMSEWEFIGEPYIFDIDEDRRRRVL